MGIIYDPSEKLFHLQANGTSYIMQVVKGGYLAHLYWGRKITHVSADHLLRYAWRASFCPNPEPDDKSFSLDTLPQEYPSYGSSDFRIPAFQVQLEDGSTVSCLKYQEHRISKGKPALPGLPSTYAESPDEAETLEIVMVDQLCGLRVSLLYTVYEKYDAVTRSVRFENCGTNDIKLLRALSMNVDFGDSEFDMLHLYGAWANERNVERKPLLRSIQTIQSIRGSSSHQHNPFLALLRPDTGEDAGEAFGFSLVYSGSFVAQAEVDQFKTTRVSMGINPFDFTWLLEPGALFQTPEAVMVHSSCGIGGLSRTYHRLYRTRLCRGAYRDSVRPVLINNWEATYFDFNTEKIKNIAGNAAELGIELFVLDDGWFGERNSDDRSLGDWFVNASKLPEGLKYLAEHVNSLGMKFGLWFEPEMVSPDSRLYREHPDWCLHVSGRERTQGRNQLVLDYSREDVCDYIIKVISDILSGAPISYVKWDMNRNMTEVGSALLSPARQKETAHRYMLGLYRVLERITGSFPEVLFESCSGGGGRFDPGMLYYMPQTWTSDNTDAVERLKIQYGTSMVYPPATMGAHVSAVPNHQMHRITPLETRGNIAMSGNFGYEMDLGKLSREEKDTVRKQISFYKEVRELVQFGEFYRLRNPFENEEAAWNFVSCDKRQAFAVYGRMLAEPGAPLRRLRLKGLEKDLRYVHTATGEAYSGDELMYAGLPLPEVKGDFQSFCWLFRAESPKL